MEMERFTGEIQLKEQDQGTYIAVGQRLIERMGACLAISAMATS